MAKLKKIGVWSLAKLQAIIMAIVGFFAGLFFWGISTLLGGAAGFGGMPPSYSMFGMGGAILIIGMPILYGLMGLVFGALGAVVYNLVAGWVGGLELEFEQ